MENQQKNLAHSANHAGFFELRIQAGKSARTLKNPTREGVEKRGQVFSFLYCLRLFLCVVDGVMR